MAGAAEPLAGGALAGAGLARRRRRSCGCRAKANGRWPAGRAASTPFHFGDTLDPSWANYDATYTYGRGRKGSYRAAPTANRGLGGW